MSSGKKSKRVDRTDKWYVLAKEQGYRSRAAFKLSHINKEYNLITKDTRVVLDLCAAPGGWSQIAAKEAGAGCAVIAVDLLPIRPIPNVRTIVGDITLDRTHAMVKREAKESMTRGEDEEGRAGRYVDVVLCDGAPNVGATYTKDAFVQNEIALLALKCGVSCGLRRGGSYVTKVYRGQDYNSLTWAFGRLFDRVRAHKPPSSRAQSAEIFVVCTGYLAPHRVDPRLLDPKHVFMDINGDGQPIKPLAVLHPQAGKKKRQRQGYAENSSGSLRQPTMTATEFLQSPDPTQILAERSKIVFEEDEIGQHASTNEEIKACAEDLRVLSKGDFRALLKWREKLLKEGLLKVFDEESSSSEEEEEGEVELDSDAEEDEVQRQIEAQKALVAKDARREKKKRAKEKQKARLRRGAGIVEESNVDEATREQVFSFSEAVKVGGVEALKDQVLDSDEEDGAMNIRPQKGEFGKERAALYEDYLQPEDRMEAIEDQLDTAYEAYADRRAEKSGAPRVEKNKRAKKYRDAVAARIVQDDVELIDGDVADYAKQLRQGDESSDESSSDESEVDAQAQSSAKRWFANPLFDAAAVEMPKSERVLRKEKRLKAQQRKDRRDARRGDVEQELDIVETKPEEVFDVKQTAARALIKAGVGKTVDASEGFEIVQGGRGDDDGLDPFSRREQGLKTYLSDSEDEDDRAETLALASMMLRRSKAKKLVDASYNRFAWNDPKDLPAWFIDDEKRHYRPQVPIKPELLAEMKLRFQSLAAKPIKKVAEARARKRTRAEHRLKAAKKKAEAVSNDPDMSAGRKLKEVEKAMARAAKPKRPDKVYVVASKTKAGSRKSTVANKATTKGSRVVSVDARMKKDKRATKSRAKKQKKFGKRKKGKH